MRRREHVHEEGVRRILTVAIASLCRRGGRSLQHATTPVLSWALVVEGRQDFEEPEHTELHARAGAD
jgi:hypothetical protein